MRMSNPSPCPPGVPECKIVFMPEAPAGGLFGRICVKQGFATEAQILAALQMQEELLKNGVRKPLGQILIEQNILTEGQVNAVLKIQGYREQRAADKQLAQLVLENQFATPEQIDQALDDQKQAFKNGRMSITLEELLLQKGIINAQQLRALKRAQKQMGAPPPPTSQVGVKECPQCFEYIKYHLTECPDCGFSFPKLSERPACKACRAPLDKPGEFCPHCGVSRVSGQKPGPDKIMQCGACEKYNAAYQTDCSSCGTPLWRTQTRRAVRGIQKHGRRIARVVVPIALLIAIALVILNFGAIVGVVGRMIEGESFDVRRACDGFLDAVVDKDFKGAIQHVYNEKGFDETRGVYDMARVFLSSPGDDYLIGQYSIKTVKVEGAKATVDIDVVFFKPNQMGTDQHRSVTLTWRKDANRWRLEF